MNSDEIIVRPFETRDRAAVREICCDTADAGKPMESFFSDREVLADVITRYYTDFEPESSWVAGEIGRVVGYLNGCLNTKRFVRVLACRIVPVTVVKAFVRGSLWHPYIRSNLHLPAKGGFSRRQVLAEYPAHLHINLRRDFRGHGTGPRLMEQFFRYATAAGVCGVHVGVGSGNVQGQQFFQRSGFVELGREARWQSGQTIIYGKRLFP